ncbi:MAG: DUF420 domain-containing protein [Haloarculaceae archaeon]
MAVADRVRTRVRARPRIATAVLSVVGYALVFGAFGGLLPLPDLSRGTVVALGDAIAVVNTAALVSILAGVYFIKRRQIRRHRAAMLTAFALIVVFLAMYLLKVGGGFEKEIVASGIVWYAYVTMLAIHVLLSALAVPVVLHAVVLGLTHSPAELPTTEHPTVGRIAVAAWSLSLALGIVTYLMLNHLYSWVPRQTALLVLIAVPGLRRE